MTMPECHVQDRCGGGGQSGRGPGVCTVGTLSQSSLPAVGTRVARTLLLSVGGSLLAFMLPGLGLDFLAGKHCVGLLTSLTPFLPLTWTVRLI